MVLINLFVKRKAEEDWRDDESKAREGEGGGGREGENKTGNIAIYVIIGHFIFEDLNVFFGGTWRGSTESAGVVSRG